MTRAPMVSVGLPVFNGERFVEQSIVSVLDQSYGDFELVISDNASTDGTEAICRRYVREDSRVRYVRQATNVGAAENFNRLVAITSGRYFKWHAADDRIAPTFLERCLEPLEADPGVVLCYPTRRHMTPAGHPVPGEPYLVPHRQRREDGLDDLSIDDLARLCSSRMPLLVFGLARRSALERTRLIGAFPASDVALVFELRLAGAFRQVREPLYFQRLHAPTPAVQARMTRIGDAEWFGRVGTWARTTPELTLAVEMAGSILRSELPTVDKARALAALRGHVEGRCARALSLARRRGESRLWELWSRFTAGAVESPDEGLIRLRAWLALAAIRARRPEDVVESLRPLTDTRRERVLARGRELLARRNADVAENRAA